MTDAVMWPALRELELEQWESPLYDQSIHGRSLFKDAATGAEHLLIRYPQGLRARRHTHTQAHTMIVLEGCLLANGVEIPAGGYVHFSAGMEMTHEPAAGGGALFVIAFDGPIDGHVVGEVGVGEVGEPA